MQNKNSIIIGADSASSYLCNNKLVRLNNTAKKLFIFGNEVMFCSGKKNVVNHIIDMIEIEGDSINKSSLQKALQDLNLPNDTNLFDIEIIICGVKNNKSYICQLSQYKNFQISYNYIDSDNIEVFAAGFKSNKCLDIAKSEFNLCNGIIEDIYINTFNKMVCDEIGGYLNTFYINNNHIKVLHKDIKLDDIILENQILQTDNRIHYVIADMLVGDLLCGNKLKIVGGKDETTGNATVVIDGNGITLDGGAIKWKKKLPTSSVEGLDDTVNGFVDAIGDLQSQIDGEITSWFEEYEPTTTNEPASTWTTDADKIKHEGDLFYNTATGAAYRYIYNSSTKQHEWSVITDTAITEALEKASKAQDTADKKRRVFVVTPTPPYDIGDLWSQGEYGDLMKCKTAKTEGQSYSASDWEKASKYTDDTAWKTWTSDSGEFGKYKQDIKNQIDGKSNCTYGGSTPPSNPETGDLWFCTDGSGGYGANKAYMYNGSVWKESNGVPDSVWDIADGKSSIFVVKPNKALSSVDSNFYHKNDIWILESDMTLNGKDYKAGSIMTATSDSTEFDQTHWVEKVRYTDDTKANSVETAINIFQTNVNNLLNADISTTVIGEDYVFAPKIGGGYLYIKNASDKRSVTIDPQQTYSSGGNIFKITDKYGNITIGADSNGNAIFNGKVTASSGNIGGWDIGTGENLGWLINYGTTSAYGDCGIYWENTDYYTILNQSNWEMGTNDACLFRLNVNNPNYIGHGSDGSDDNRLYCNLGYINMTSKGYIDVNSNNSINFNSNNSINFNDLTKFYNGIRIQATLSDYSELGVSALDSSAINTYFTVKSSTAIKHRLQVGAGIDGFYTGYTFYVGGSSYVTGTSYTNSGTTVTSDKNKKNSISTPSNYYVQLFDAINLRRFKYNDGTSDRYHLGVIAQELEEAMRSVGISSQDFGGLVVDEQGNYFVRYDEINMLTALKVKQLEERIKVLEDKLK